MSATPQPHATLDSLRFRGLPIVTVNGIAFDQEERSLFVAVWQPDRTPEGRRRLRIVEWRNENGNWTGPLAAPFSRTPYTDYQPVYSHDRQRLYFQSTRPLPGDSVEVRQNLWYVDRTATGWSEPRYIDALNTPYIEGYAAPTANGVLYFNSNRPGGLGSQDVYRSRVSGDRYSAPEPVMELNSADGENDLVVDPRERFVIFNRFRNADRSIDLFIAFRSGNGWGPARKLNNVNDTMPTAWELTPSISPDGRRFYYTMRDTIRQVPLASLIYEDEMPGFGVRRRER